MQNDFERIAETIRARELPIDAIGCVRQLLSKKPDKMKELADWLDGNLEATDSQLVHRAADLAGVPKHPKWGRLEDHLYDQMD